MVNLQLSLVDTYERMNTMNMYPEEKLAPDWDDGTMPENVDMLRQAVVGHRIVKVEQGVEVPEEARDWYRDSGLKLTLDDGRAVYLVDTDDCCAYTELENVITHLDKIDHMIMGVGTTDGYTKWHIYADWGDVVELDVGWSSGNPFYYGYGFAITVVDTAPDQG